MNPLAFDLTGAEVWQPQTGLVSECLSLAEGWITADRVGRKVDLTGYLVLPGIVDLHGDGFERHLAPRRGAMKQVQEGVFAAEAELAANGRACAGPTLPQRFSWRSAK